MTWRESTTAVDVQIQPQWSDDLQGWNAAALTVESISSGPGWREQRATLDISTRPRAALRLLVTLP